MQMLRRLEALATFLSPARHFGRVPADASQSVRAHQDVRPVERRSQLFLAVLQLFETIILTARVRPAASCPRMSCAENGDDNYHLEKSAQHIG